MLLQHWWQPSRLTSVICCVRAGRVTVSWLLLSSSHHRPASQLLLNTQPNRFLPRVSTLLMRAARKVTASWRREVELEVAGRLLGQLFHHSDYQLGFDSGTDAYFHLTALLPLLFQISGLHSLCVQTLPCEYAQSPLCPSHDYSFTPRPNSGITSAESFWSALLF